MFYSHLASIGDTPSLNGKLTDGANPPRSAYESKLRSLLLCFKCIISSCVLLRAAILAVAMISAVWTVSPTEQHAQPCNATLEHLIMLNTVDVA
jgi:hypothetical protein